VVHIIWGQGGWFAEFSPEREIVGVLTPKRFTKENIAQYVEQLSSAVPESSRIPIRDP
jgi:hypothetical protein